MKKLDVKLKIGRLVREKSTNFSLGFGDISGVNC
jgi:hypothetical protein